MTKPDRPKAARSSGNFHSVVDPIAEATRLTALLEPTVAAAGLFLEEVKVQVAGAHRTVSVVVDLPETETGGVGLDAIAHVSKVLSETMDADPNDDGQPYNLEISSPGATRPLTEPRHWRRATGRMVRVNAVGRENLLGRILAVDDDGVQLLPELPVKKGMKAKQGEPEKVLFSAIRRGVVEIEFARLDQAELDLEFEPTGGDAVDGEES
ncbi:ribosome maturation factor RimP [Arthrobacter sp. STN4]|uniref:ribosome maturation factor RimP n=1 Tax=Arthrobacter sp. STN4 TaxID=2923276 RepID=UPI00211A2B90|nr:ribosome maturation factor RimP [Arthrobacter sp. STN4]MCQ9165636.1 ribosome maturation factor RimP [Arthrobacter sp. STN4]